MGAVTLHLLKEPKFALGVTALALGLLTWFAVTRALRFWSIRRIDRLDTFEGFEVIANEPPASYSPDEAITRAKESVKKQYRNTRQLLLPILVTTTLVLAALPFMPEIPAALMSIYLGAGSLVVGMAAKPLGENFFAGLVMGFSRLLNIGDTVVVNGHYATVEEISMTHTTLKIWDWRRYIIPNSKMLASEFVNYSVFDNFIWAYVEFWISYEADLEAIKTAGAEAAKASKYWGGWSDPEFWVMEANKEGVVCWMAAWANTPADAWYLKADMRAGIMQAVQNQGVQTHCFHFRSTPEAGPEAKKAAAVG